MMTVHLKILYFIQQTTKGINLALCLLSMQAVMIRMDFDGETPLFTRDVASL